MGKHKSKVWNHFKKLPDKKVSCLYCHKEYFVNATRMMSHITKECRRCPSPKPLASTSKTKSGRNTTTSLLSQASSSSTLGSFSDVIKENIENNVQFRQFQSKVSSFVDKMSPKENEKLNMMVGRAIYDASLPFTIVENQKFKEFIQCLRPSYNLPCRKSIATSIMDKQYSQIKTSVTRMLEQSTSFSMLCDGWSDINNTPILNIIFTTPEPVFYKAIHTQLERHTGKFIFEILSEAIEAVGSEKVHAFVSDNARNMKAAWNLLQEKYPTLVIYGCLAHGLNLLAKDITTLNVFSNIIAHTKKIVQTFRNKHLPSQLLKKIQKESGNGQALHVPVEPRWGTYTKCLQSVLNNKENLQTAAVKQQIQNQNQIENPVRNKILDEDSYWPGVERCLKILSPISEAIHKLEGDKNTIGCVVGLIKYIETSILEHSSLFSVDTGNNIKEMFYHRKEFVCHEIHYAASLLDARQQVALSEEEIEKAVDKILEIGSNIGLKREQLLIDIAEYRAREKLWKSTTMWEAARKMEPVTWWKGLCSTRSLALVAERILNFPATSAAAERNFKTFSLIKTKKRNRLTLERTEKLVYIKSNIKFLNIESENAIKNDEENVEHEDVEVEGETMEFESNEYEYESTSSENEDANMGSSESEIEEIEETDDDICRTETYAKNIEDTACDKIANKEKAPRIVYYSGDLREGELISLYHSDESETDTIGN